MSKEKLINLLDKFHIEYKKYGEEERDALEVISERYNVIITITQFDDNCEVAYLTMRPIQKYEKTDGMFKFAVRMSEARRTYNGWASYAELQSIMLKIVNSEF